MYVSCGRLLHLKLLAWMQKNVREETCLVAGWDTISVGRASPVIEEIEEELVGNSAVRCR